MRAPNLPLQFIVNANVTEAQTHVRRADWQGRIKKRDADR
jgi:hypothetical protein